MPALRDILKKLVPGALRQRIKQRWESQFIDAVTVKLNFTGSPEGLDCQIDGQWSFKLPEVCRGDMDYFVNNPGGRSEFYGLAKRARAGGVFFDIGASSGVISALLCAANDKNMVYCFEPSPPLCKRMEEVRAMNNFGGRMPIEPVAIGEKAGNMEMLIDPWGGFVQTQRFDNSMWTEPERIQVRIESIAEASTRLGVVPDCIKLDIEGFEYEALKGAQEFLTKHKPACFVELHLNYLRQRNVAPRTVVEMLEQCGYRFSTYGGRPLSARALYSTPLANIHFLAQ